MTAIAVSPDVKSRNPAGKVKNCPDPVKFTAGKPFTALLTRVGCFAVVDWLVSLPVPEQSSQLVTFELLVSIALSAFRHAASPVRLPFGVFASYCSVAAVA